MRVGSLVYATDQGLGILAKDFFDHGVFNYAAVIRHGRRRERDDWYEGHLRVTDLRAESQKTMLRDFCASMDVMLFFETPFDWELVEHCKRAGVKTVIMPMHECMPARLPYVPDFFVCPSELDQRCYEQDYPGKSAFIPVPVPDHIEWRERMTANSFVHNAGWGGLKGRNGTREFVQALRLVKKPIKVHMRMQEQNEELESEFLKSPSNVEITLTVSTVPQCELYAAGDVFVFPEKFNGLSLPLQEAFASGMLVMATNRYPMNLWLPRQPLITTSGSRVSRVGPSRRSFDEAIVEPAYIAAKIDEFAGTDISAYSMMGRLYLEEFCWRNLKSEYMEVLWRVYMASM
jgi:hypothetical protein